MSSCFAEKNGGVGEVRGGGSGLLFCLSASGKLDLLDHKQHITTTYSPDVHCESSQEWAVRAQGGRGGRGGMECGGRGGQHTVGGMHRWVLKINGVPAPQYSCLWKAGELLLHWVSTWSQGTLMCKLQHLG